MMTKSLTDEEIAAFAGLNESYIEMDMQLSRIAPRCHFRPMSLESGDGEKSVSTWWECFVCGHTKGNI